MRATVRTHLRWPREPIAEATSAAARSVSTSPSSRAPEASILASEASESLTWTWSIRRHLQLDAAAEDKDRWADLKAAFEAGSTRLQAPAFRATSSRGNTSVAGVIIMVWFERSGLLEEVVSWISTVL